jgi:hypothetical protein
VGAQTRAQKQEAARSTPQPLRARGSDDARVAEHTLRLRMHATPRDVATVLAWQKQFGELLDCVNNGLVPDFGVSLEAVDLRAFRPQADEETLAGVSECAYPGARGRPLRLKLRTA